MNTLETTSKHLKFPDLLKDAVDARREPTAKSFNQQVMDDLYKLYTSEGFIPKRAEDKKKRSQVARISRK